MKVHCNNYNHGRTNPPICFCPTCGGKLASQVQASRSCDSEKHSNQRKNRSKFCSDCGKDLSK